MSSTATSTVAGRVAGRSAGFSTRAYSKTPQGALAGQSLAHTAFPCATLLRQAIGTLPRSVHRPRGSLAPLARMSLLALLSALAGGVALSLLLDSGETP